MSSMNKTQEKIAAGLEGAFAQKGFAQVGVDALREASQVSLRTLYKYCPSREDMVLMALEHRHSRYLTYLFEELPAQPSPALNKLLDRVGGWMEGNDRQGCLFQSALIADPDNAQLKDILKRHKAEVGSLMSKATGLMDHKNQLMLLHEGIIQSWPVLGHEAVSSAKQLAGYLIDSPAN